MMSVQYVIHEKMFHQENGYQNAESQPISYYVVLIAIVPVTVTLQDVALPVHFTYCN